MLAASAVQAEPQHITAYRLPPDKLAQAEALYRTHVFLSFASLALGLLAVRSRCSSSACRRATATSRSARAGAASSRRSCYVPLALLTMALVSLPIDVYQQHVMRAYGLSVQGWASWLATGARPRS